MSATAPSHAAGWAPAGGRAPLVVAGRYEVELDPPLGAGGMAVVYRGRDLKTRREVALKTLRLEYRASPDARARFRYEVRLQAFVAHPNVARVYDLHEEQDAPWAVQEYVPGRSLKELLAERGPRPPAEVASLLAQAAAALDHLHERGIVHLDVKPQNLLVTPGGDLKVIDFGLAQAAGESQELIGGTTFGTAAYLAPEQASGEAVDAATDVYSLGCVVYELLTGRPPFEPAGPGEAKHEVIRAHLERPPLPPTRARPDLRLPAALDDVVLWALAKRPADRYRDAASFARLFAETAGGSVLGSAATTAPVALIDVEDPPRNARYFQPPPPQPSAAQRLGRVPAGAYRLGGRLARASRGLVRTLWRVTVALALANAVLALLLLWRDGTDGLRPGGPTLRSGGAARVATDDLNLRAAPGMDAASLDRLDRGAALSLTGAPVEADGRTWWPVAAGGGSTGFVWAGGLEPAPDRPAWVERAEERVEEVLGPLGR